MLGCLRPSNKPGGVVAPPASRQASLGLPESRALPGHSPVHQRAQKLAAHTSAQVLDPRPQGLPTSDRETQWADTYPRINTALQPAMARPSPLTGRVESSPGPSGPQPRPPAALPSSRHLGPFSQLPPGSGSTHQWADTRFGTAWTSQPSVSGISLNHQQSDSSSEQRGLCNQRF